MTVTNMSLFCHPFPFLPFLSIPFLLLPEPRVRSQRINLALVKNLNKFQVMDSLAETSMNADVVQDVVVVQYAKILLALINVLADLDSKVSLE